MKKLNLSFDIGESHIKIARREKDKIVVHVAKMPENLFKEGKMLAPHLVADYIKDLRQQYKIPRTACGLVVPEELVVCRNLTLPAMTEEQLMINLPFEFTDYISDEPQKYVYDYALKEMIYDEAGNPKEMNLTAAVMSKESVDTYVSTMRNAGLDLRVIVPPEIAMSNVMRNAVEEKRIAPDEEFCIVNLGYKMTQVFIYKGESLAVLRKIHMGTVEIDKAIAENENVDEFVAKTYRNTNYNYVLRNDYVREQYLRIAVEIRKVINFYRFNNRSSEIKNMYFVGPGSSLEGLCDIITENNELQLGVVNELLPPSTQLGIEFSGLNAIGVMMQ